MKNMIYTSKRGRKVIFDDYEDNTKEFNSYWVEMCPHCHRKYTKILKGKFDDGGTACGICSVKGCENDAEYYADFNMDEVTFED